MIWIKSIMVGLGTAVGGAGLLVVSFTTVMSIKARQMPVAIGMDSGGNYIIFGSLAMLFLLGFGLANLRLRRRVRA
jgi:hypothetical protein